MIRGALNLLGILAFAFLPLCHRPGDLDEQLHQIEILVFAAIIMTIVVQWPWPPRRR